MSFTSCPSFVSCRAQCCEPPQASIPIRHGARFTKCSRNLARLICRFTISPVSASTLCTWSGSSSALLRHRPLRTGRASHPASGSSHSSAPRCGTEQLDGTLRSSTASEVRGPHRIKWISQFPNLDVSRNRDRHCAEEPKPAGAAISGTLRSKVPGPVPIDLEVPVPHPPCSFHGMSTLCPFPEQLPDVRVYR
ncbi:hypothetical protein QFZ94_000042 [Paraburkholderia sp. JPY465]